MLIGQLGSNCSVYTYYSESYLELAKQLWWSANYDEVLTTITSLFFLEALSFKRFDRRLATSLVYIAF